MKGLQWILAYTLMFAALRLSAGALSDPCRRPPRFRDGVGSIRDGLRGLRRGSEPLATCAARILQGTAAALTMPSSMPGLVKVFRSKLEG